MVHMGPNSVYVPGAGFSGFWFTLGRLQSMDRPQDKEYYCFSAGCLETVATLTNRPIHEMLVLANGAQNDWRQGRIGMYDVTSKFIDGLLGLDESHTYQTTTSHESTSSSPLMNGVSPNLMDLVVLGKIHVVTTARVFSGLRHVIRTPTTIAELREMLIQTTFM
mmetsp:Transcript_11582/g.21093  ORF Transcript_11582/g.21093 Transcript_11582/m.21093 type:complete len:164 (-) Transcript_11582:560-1051(-)